KASEAGRSVFAGVSVEPNDVLVMYTYRGDANLDGKLNIDDYTKIDQGIASKLKGWSNGDFNYDGKVDIDDYTTVIDSNIGNQNGFIFPTTSGVPASAGTIVSAVPEPISHALLIVPAMMCARRRRK